jgi:hypothetical protein
VNVNRIARWDGAGWVEFGGGFDGEVAFARELPGGDVLAGGAFASAGAFASPNFARWSCPVCDPLDFNGDEVFPDTQDIFDFVFVFGGGACPSAACDDIDFNNDGTFPDTKDVLDYIIVFSGGNCPG